MLLCCNLCFFVCLFLVKYMCVIYKEQYKVNAPHGYVFDKSVLADRDKQNKHYKKMYEGILYGDPKMRILRILWQEIYTDYNLAIKGGATA